MAERGAVALVRARTAWAGIVPKETVLRVTDVAGQQVGDLVLFRADDVTERFSQANTRKLENTLYLHQGSRLWSTKCTVLARLLLIRQLLRDLPAAAWAGRSGP